MTRPSDSISDGDMLARRGIGAKPALSEINSVVAHYRKLYPDRNARELFISYLHENFPGTVGHIPSRAFIDAIEESAREAGRREGQASNHAEAGLREIVQITDGVKNLSHVAQSCRRIAQQYLPADETKKGPNE